MLQGVLEVQDLMIGVRRVMQPRKDGQHQMVQEGYWREVQTEMDWTQEVVQDYSMKETSQTDWHSRKEVQQQKEKG